MLMNQMISSSMIMTVLLRILMPIQMREQQQLKLKISNKVWNNGTLYCVAITYFLEEYWDLVINLGSNPKPLQLRFHINPQTPAYCILAKSYMNKENPLLNKMSFKHIGFTAINIERDDPAMFNGLDVYTFEYTVKFLYTCY